MCRTTDGQSASASPSGTATCARWRATGGRRPVDNASVARAGEGHTPADLGFVKVGPTPHTPCPEKNFCLFSGAFWAS